MHLRPAHGQGVDDGGRGITAYVYDGPDILIETDATRALLALYAHGDRFNGCSP